MPETAGALAPRSHETEDAQVRVLRDALGKRLDGFAKIFGELSELARRVPTLAQTAGAFSFQGWRGHMAEHENGASSVSIRTFFAADPALAA